MFRSVLCLLSASFLSTTLQAQTSNPVVTEMKAAYTSIKYNLLKAAEKAPEDIYAFKPAPEMRSLGELIQHIAEAQINYCGRVNGVTAKPDFGSKSKTDIVKAFQTSFDVCDAGWAALTDANATEMTGAGRGALSKLGALIRNVIHDNEEYGYLSVYFRMKGIVPPSSDTAGRGGRGGL
jgi:DinB superfamily